MVSRSGTGISDAQWARIVAQLAHPAQPMLPSTPAGRAGRRPSDVRIIFNGIVHVLRTGIPWRALPRTYGSATTAHRRFHAWLEAGLFTKLREAGIREFGDLETIARERSQTGKDLPPISKPFQDARSETGQVESLQAVAARTDSATQGVRERIPSLYEPRIQSLVLRLHAATTARAFWASMQSLFQETVPNDAMIAYIDYLDHPTSWQASKILATPNAKMSPEWFAQKWRVEPTPRFITEHPRIKLYRFSDMFSDPRESCKTELFKRFMKPYGWHHIVTSLYWDGTRPRSGISLRRTRQQGDFQPAEMDLLRSL